MEKHTSKITKNSVGNLTEWNEIVKFESWSFRASKRLNLVMYGLKYNLNESTAKILKENVSVAIKIEILCSRVQTTLE